MNLETMFKHAEDFYALGEYNKALKFFEKINAMRSNNDSLNYIGCCHLELGDYEQAREIFLQLTATSPDWERPYFNMGRVYLREGNTVAAYEWLTKAKMINPSNEDCLYYLGVYYESLGNYHMAIEYYKLSISVNYSQSETHLNLGVCYFNQENFNEAMHEFQVARSTDSSCYAALYNQARILMKFKEYQKAIEKLLECIRQKPDDIDCMMHFVRSYIKLGKPELAHDWNNRILSIQPDNKTALAANKIFETI